MGATNKATMFYEDDVGGTSAQKFRVLPAHTNPTDLNPLRDALDAVTKGLVFRQTIATQEVNAGAASDSPLDVHDKAVLEFRDADGNPYKFVLPDPDPAIFNADESVNAADPDIAALITEILALVVTQAGVILAAYIKGWRTRRTPKHKP